MQRTPYEPLPAAPNSSELGPLSGCLFYGNRNAIPLLEKDSPFAALPQIQVVRYSQCEHRYLADWPRTLELPLYNYYANRLDWPRKRVYNDLTTE